MRRGRDTLIRHSKISLGPDSCDPNLVEFLMSTIPACREKREEKMGMTNSNTNNDVTPRDKRADLKLFQTPEIGGSLSPTPGSNGTRKHRHATDPSIADTEPVNDTTETGNPTDDDSEENSARSSETGSIAGIPLIGPQVVKARDMVDSLRGKK
jgi:hypothetical protein